MPVVVVLGVDPEYMPAVALGIEQVAVAAVDYYDIPAVGIVVGDIVVVAAVGIGTVVVGVAAVDSWAAGNVDVGLVVVGSGSGAQLGMDHAHLNSSHLAYLHVAATENQRCGFVSVKSLPLAKSNISHTYPSLSNKLLNFGLTPPFEFHILFVRELRLLINSFPSWIFLEFFPFRLGQKLFHADHTIAIGIHFAHYVLSHAFHFLFTFTHVVFGMTRLIHFIQIIGENRFQFSLVQLSVVVKI